MWHDGFRRRSAPPCGIELFANRSRDIEHGLVPHLDEASFARETVAMTRGVLAAD
jgi:hypothetical protein